MSDWDLKWTKSSRKIERITLLSATTREILIVFPREIIFDLIQNVTSTVSINLYFYIPIYFFTHSCFINLILISINYNFCVILKCTSFVINDKNYK